jgi:hypothetical protein
VGFPFLALEAVPDTDVSDAPEGFLDNLEDGGNGVLDPLDGVRTLVCLTADGMLVAEFVHTELLLIGVPTPVRVGMLEALWIEPNLEGTPLAGLINPVGVRGRELEPFTGVASLLPDMLLCLLDVGVLPEPMMVLRGIRLGVESSSKDCVDPYRLGGLLPCLDAGRLLGLLVGREAGLEVGLLDGRLPPGVDL